MESNCFYEKAFLPSLESPITKTVSLKLCRGINSLHSCSALEMKSVPREEGSQGSYRICFQSLKQLGQEKSPLDLHLYRHRQLHRLPHTHKMEAWSRARATRAALSTIYCQEAMVMKPMGKARAQGQSAITGGHISDTSNTS